GRWGKGSQYSGRVYFVLEPGSVPGRWNTLRALRVLNWWDEGDQWHDRDEAPTARNRDRTQSVWGSPG
ncbi:MAG: hypothetical protein M3092_07680, partial [Actinomycetia bacterium]|nr:hypothetical protein [Actinomycetes bacterium]